MNSDELKKVKINPELEFKIKNGWIKSGTDEDCLKLSMQIVGLKSEIRALEAALERASHILTTEVGRCYICKENDEEACIDCNKDRELVEALWLLYLYRGEKG